jgi:tetratricopeptide (TPR) repeat protein
VLALSLGRTSSRARSSVRTSGDRWVAASDVRVRRASEEDHGGGDVFGHAQAAGRRTRANALANVLGKTGEIRFRDGEAGRDEVAEDAGLRSFPLQRGDEPLQPRLGRGELFRAELGREPGPAVFRATEATAASRLPSIGRAGRATAQARIETGRSAVNAGSFESGVKALARATAEANACDDRKLDSDAWLALGTALVHSARGRDEEGADALLRAAAVAEADCVGDVAAAAHRELGYTDILQARYARCARRLDRAAAFAESDKELAGVEAMHGLAAADTGAHDRALVHLQRSVELAERAGSRQQAAFSLSFVGRSRFLREELTEARSALERSLAIARETKWVAFEPWPESWLAEAELAAGEIPAGRDRFEHAWALASELGDPCWEGTAGQGLGRIACLEGEVAGGLRMLEEARRVAGSYPDAYVGGGVRACGACLSGDRG